MTADLLNCRQYAQQGITAMERGDWPRAEQLLAMAVKSCPTDHEARRHYAEALWRRGARAEAIKQLSEASRFAGDDLEVLVRLAEMHQDNGRPDVALDLARQAAKLDPTHRRIAKVRAKAYRSLERPREALAEYQRALNTSPEDQELLLETAEIYRQLNEPRRALAQLQTLLETYSPGEEPARALYLAGLACEALGRDQQALEHLRTAVERTPQASPDLLCHVGELELRLGRPDQANDWGQQALALHPQHPRGQKLLESARQAQATAAIKRR